LSDLSTLTNPEPPSKRLEGGIIGGTIAQGKFRRGRRNRNSPQASALNEKAKPFYDPLISEIVSLHAGEQSVKEATSGGLVAVGTLP
jgi:translation initiation factor 2 subunit 3